MKKVLLQIAALQNAVISTFENKTAGQLLSNVAGADLGGTIPHSEYKIILQNINDFSKDRSRFKEDSTKIVIQKNVFVHLIKNLGGYFIFRGMNADNYLNIQTSSEFYKIADKHVNQSDHRFLSYVMAALLLFAGFDFAFTQKWIWLIATILIATATFWWHEGNYKENKKRQEGLADCFQPDELFQGSVASIPVIKGGHFDGELKCKLTIDLTPELGAESGIDNWYRQTVYEMTILASKLKGEIGWLWKYRHESGLEIKDDVRFMTGWPELQIKNHATRLLPVIETESSFVFYFPNLKGEELFQDIVEDEADDANKVNGVFALFGEKLFLDVKDLERNIRRITHKDW